MSLLEIAEFLANGATLLGVPMAIFLFMNEKRRERREREYGTYDALDEKFIDYMQLCLENPELDLYEMPLDPAPTLSGTQQIR